MSRHQGILRLLCVGFACVAMGFSAPKCRPVSPSEEQVLIRFVRHKYRLPPGMPVRLVREGGGDHCYERIRFVSGDASRYFEYSVFLSPDHLFLIPQLLDSRTNPADLEERQWQQIQGDLVHGSPPSKGPPKAPVTIVVFTDFQCPYSLRAARKLRSEVLAALESQVRVIVRHFPLPRHNWSLVAAKAAACIGWQSEAAFWEAHDYIFEHQAEFTPRNISDNLVQFASSVRGVDVAEFRHCLESDLASKRIAEDIELGKSYGVDGTPAVFVNGRRVSAGDTEATLALIQRLIEDSQSGVSNQRRSN